MSRKQFTVAVAGRAEVSYRETDRVLTALAALVRESIARGEEIRIPGVGRLYPAMRGPRRLVNPTTLQIHDLPASYHVRFRAADALKAASNR